MPHQEPHGRCNLVIPRAAGVDLSAEFAERRGQMRFDGGMAVLEFVGNRKLAFAGQRIDAGQLGHQAVGLVLREHFGALQRADMRGRAEDSRSESSANRAADRRRP